MPKGCYGIAEISGSGRAEMCMVVCYSWAADKSQPYLLSTGVVLPSVDA